MRSNVGGDAGVVQRWSPVTFLTWLCEREPVPDRVVGGGRRPCMVALMLDERRRRMDGRTRGWWRRWIRAKRPPRMILIGTMRTR